MSTQLANTRLIAQGKPLSHEDIQRNIEGFLSSQIAKKGHVLNREMANAPANVTGMKLDGLLKKLQDAVHHRISKLAAAPPAAVAPTSPPISWADENIRLQSFYKHLQNSPNTAKAFKLCEVLRQNADHGIRGQVHVSTPTRRDSSAAQQAAVITKLREAIGQVVFAADVMPKKLSPGIDVSKIPETTEFVEKLVGTHLDAIVKDLVDRNAKANAYSLQDPDMLMFVEKPKAVANVILTSQGQLNLGMINAVKKHFFTPGKDLLEYEQGVIFVLDRLDTNWQASIDAIQMPVNLGCPSNAMIRADLGLSPGEPVTKLHCQVEVMGALLSQLCQGPVGDCFAVSWAIKKHDEFLQNAFADYAALAHNGYLTRPINGTPEQFFFETTIACDARSDEITVDASGNVAEYSSAPFWECPNVIAACRQMGMADPVSSKDAILQALAKKPSGAGQTTWDDLIAACAAVAAGPHLPSDELLELGRYGFSLADNRLLRAWETSLGAMAEARPGDNEVDNVNQCVMSVYQGVFASQEQKASTYNKSLVEEVKKIFQQTMANSFRFLYNGDIPLAEVASDGSSSSGGFELYQRNANDLTSKGVRIATPEQFRTFLGGVIDQASAAARASVPSQKDRAVLDSVLQALHLCTLGPNFLKNVLYAYDNDNKKDPDPVANYQKLSRTPMTSLDGDNPWEVMAIDTGKDFTPDIRTIKPKDPGALLKWLLGLAQWKQSTEHYLSNAVNEENEATGPDHAFNIEFDGPDFRAFMASGLSADAWIKQTISDPGMKIAKAEMDNGTKVMFENTVKQWLSGQINTTMPENLVQDVDNLFTSLNSKVMTVQQFSQRVQDGMVHIFKLNKDQTRSFSLALDGMVVQSLPAAQAKALQQSAVRFANTNWDSGPRDLFFCCFFNPRTGKVDFGSIKETKTGLQPMDQFEWVDNQEWDVDPLRVDLPQAGQGLSNDAPHQ